MVLLSDGKTRVTVAETVAVVEVLAAFMLHRAASCFFKKVNK